MFNLLVTQLAFTALLDQGLKAGKTPLGHVSLPCMVHGLDDGGVRVLELGVLSHQGDLNILKKISSEGAVLSWLFSLTSAMQKY